MEKKTVNHIESTEKRMLPCGKMCGWNYVHCYECPAGDYDSDRNAVWCSRNSEWNSKTSGCIMSPIS